ncbi:ABC1 kinase family protein [Shimia ponticola]|uniref:ABC1 kinase family protein n=1 Tax=Shimia ponticola TaxID=2582893 RepID=UPI0011BD690E|nr:AarF/ABC1/UbiB kinase family protein [Shimia ponticola]
MSKPTATPSAVAVPSGRATRATRIGGMAAGIAGNMALGALGELSRGQRPRSRDLLLTPRNISKIADELARMRGAAMKIGQLMSMDTGDVLPPELANIMARLRADADFMPPKQLKQVLTAEWGADWMRRFKRFDTRPIAAASIGQVHRAQTRDGRDLAIKVQYPGIARSIDSDVSNVGALIRMSGLIPKGFELAPYLDEARRQLHEEADYAQEARYLSAFHDLLGDDPSFVMPSFEADLTTPTILAMGYVPSSPIEAAEQEPQEVRDRIGHDLLRLVLRELFEFGLMQTDPNFANYRYDAEAGKIVLLDFGATRAFGKAIQRDYADLMIAGLDQDADQLAICVQRIGFIAPDTAPRHQEQILAMIGFIFAALREEPMFDFAKTDLTKRLNDMGQALAAEGFIPPPLPMDALYLQRKFAGMFLLLTRLCSRLPVEQMIRDQIGAMHD